MLAVHDCMIARLHDYTIALITVCYHSRLVHPLISLHVGGIFRDTQYASRGPVSFNRGGFNFHQEPLSVDTIFARWGGCLV